MTPAAFTSTGAVCFLMGSSYRNRKIQHRIFLQPVHALLTGLIPKRSHIYPYWTVILLPFKLAACEQLFPQPPIDGMTKMLFQSAKPSCVLWLHSMQMLTHSIPDTAIKVNPKSHMWTRWAAGMWCFKNWREKNNKTKQHVEFYLWLSYFEEVSFNISETADERHLMTSSCQSVTINQII